MTYILDYIGATVLLGIIILTVFSLNESFVTANYTHTLNAQTLETVTGYISGSDTMSGLAGLVDFDLYKVGYNAERGILYADSNRFSFSADLENDGSLDTVTYYTHPTGTIPRGGNPSRRLLVYRMTQVREVGGWGASMFRLSYLDFKGRRIAIPPGYQSDPSYGDSIRSIRVQLMVESGTRATNYDNPADTSFSRVYWEKIFSPKNLRML
jgi:hypothetical protein